MAKKVTDSFFIRGRSLTDGVGAWATKEIDLGAFVDALGKTVLRCLNIAVKYRDVGTNGPPIPGGTGSAYIQYVLTTQPLDNSTVIIDLYDKSVVASGTMQICLNGPAGGAATNYYVISETTDAAPQHWSNGYLIGVDTLYFSVYEDTQMGPGDQAVSFVMECVSEKLTGEAAMALALSQS